jgi:hypothetical protein
MYAGVNSLDNTRGLGGHDGRPALLQLRILSLPDNQIRLLDNLTGCSALQVVDLSQNYIDDLLPLTQALPPCLRALNLSNNPVASISSIRHLAALPHLMHLFVCGCAFVLTAARARVDMNPLFAALLPELVSVDNVNFSSRDPAQCKLLRNSLSQLDHMTNEQATQFLSSGLASIFSASPFALASGADALPFSDFGDEGDEEAEVAKTFTAAATVVQLPVTSSQAVYSALQLPSAKSVHVLAHDITRLKHKLASFASPATVLPPRSLVSSSAPLNRGDNVVSGVSRTGTTYYLSQNITASPDHSLLHNSAASIISRAWRSFRARELFRNRLGFGRSGDANLLVAAAATSGDTLIIRRLELLENTVAMQLHVIEKLHAAIERANAVPLPSSLPVWRIVADAIAAATLIQSVWRGHTDREVALVIRERKRYHALVTDTPGARAHKAAVAAAAVTIAAFVRRKRAEDSAKWMFLVISSQYVHRLICNMGDQVHTLGHRLSVLEGNSQQPIAEITSVAAPVLLDSSLLLASSSLSSI